MPNPKQIINGEIEYSLKDLFQELKTLWFNTERNENSNTIEKLKTFKSLFMFILLSSEDKPIEIMLKVYKIPEEKIKEGQKVFENEIEIAKAIQMKKYLDIYSEYRGGTDITIKLLNIWIKDFLNKYIKEGKYGATS